MLTHEDLILEQPLVHFVEDLRVSQLDLSLVIRILTLVTIIDS